MPGERHGTAAEVTSRGVRNEDQLEGETTVRVDCGTAAMAQLIRQVDSHGELGGIVGDGTSYATGTVAFRTPPGEPLDRLVARLGSPPPAALVEAWTRQLVNLKAQLRDARLPLHHSVLEELRVDGAARLHVPFLPLQIAVSICQAEPRCGEQGSLAPWLYAPQPPVDLGGIDRLIEAVAAMSVSRDIGRDQATRGQIAQAASSRRARWMWAGGLAVLAVIVAIALW